MNLARVSQSGIEKAASDSGLVLTADQVRDIAEAESACLAECRRISFGESAAAQIVREFAASPFISQDNVAKTLAEIVEAFYELRENNPAAVTDVEIRELLRESFDADAGGDVGLAAAMTGESLSKRLDYATYEIADSDGNIYRWDPEEWRDDVTADGWCGERWEDVDE